MEVVAVPIIVDTDIGDNSMTPVLLFLLVLKKYANIVLVLLLGMATIERELPLSPNYAKVPVEITYL